MYRDGKPARAAALPSDPLKAGQQWFNGRSGAQKGGLAVAGGVMVRQRACDSNQHSSRGRLQS